MIAPTARHLYKLMMKDIVMPALRDLGLSGPAREMRYLADNYSARLRPEKSRHSTRDSIDFWIWLEAFYDPEGEEGIYWRRQLHNLIPHHPGRWTVDAAAPFKPVAEDLVTAVREYGMPAMLAAIDSPGYPPPDPDARWARTFTASGSAPGPGGQIDLRTVLRTESAVERMLMRLASAEPIDRFMGLAMMGEKAADDPRVLPALLDRLEHDPDRKVRCTAALELQWPARQEHVRAALMAAADQDEDLEVRWAARYAIRRADLQRGEACQS